MRGRQLPPPQTMLATMFFVALLQQPPSPADTTGGRPCKIVIDSGGGQAQQVEGRAGETKAFAGGGAPAPCESSGGTPPPGRGAWVAGGSRVRTIRPKGPRPHPRHG